MTREEIIASFPLLKECERRGIKMQQKGAEFVGLCPFHREKTPSFSVCPKKNVFRCFGCNVSGSIIDFISRLDGISIGKAMENLGGKPETNGNSRPPVDFKKVAEYNYRDATGKLVFQVVRYDPKSFRQRRPVDGKWVWNLEGVVRILYRLPEVIKNQSVWIVEGEKDADNLARFGICATCNSGGAGKWMDPYTEYLKGKEIVLCPDSDDAGELHRRAVMDSLKGKVEKIRLIRLPKPHKDISDFITAQKDPLAEIIALYDNALVIPKGVDCPVKSLSELEESYVKFSTQVLNNTLQLGDWIPELGKHVRGIVPGELVVFLANTGVGKTALLQNMAINCAPLITLLFELELPETLTFERFIGAACDISCSFIEQTYRSGGSVEWKSKSKLDHIHVCSESKITPEKMKDLIVASELKIGQKPQLVMLDYIQLIQGKGARRYETVSDASEELKRIAKETGTIIVITSQISRQDDDSPEVGLFDAKESGSIENSAGLVIGVWRDPNDKTKMVLKILKNTKGRPGEKIFCKFDGETMKISEFKEKPNKTDVPELPLRTVTNDP